MAYEDILDFKLKRAMGGRISKKHKLFEVIAKLGYQKAREFAEIQFYKWYFENGDDADALSILEKYVELTGMAEFLTHTTEITRLSMILGDSRDVRDYGKRSK